MIKYLTEYGNISFDEAPLNDVDRLIFSQLAYMDFEEAADELRKNPANTSFSYALAHAVWADSDDPSEDRFAFQKKDDRQLAALAAQCMRYKQIRFVDFYRQYNALTQTQFAALTLRINDGHLLIAFRGTDNTLAGWKEDFNMAFMDEIEAQRLARLYIEEHSPEADRITVCGHSKGGNLALYAAAFCRESVQRRIDAAVSFDGPGFNEHIIQSKGFRRMEDRMHVIMPGSSIVSMLFDQPKNTRLIESRMFSVFQHYPYFWNTEKMDFIYTDRRSTVSALMGKTVCGLMEKLEAEDREHLIEEVYGLIAATEADTLNDLASGWLKSVKTIVSRLFKTDSQTRAVFQQALTAFTSAAAEAIGEMIREKRA
jgi:pimeloyl-ACP methyl ester carboxylesterase